MDPCPIQHGAVSAQTPGHNGLESLDFLAMSHEGSHRRLRLVLRDRVITAVHRPDVHTIEYEPFWVCSGDEGPERGTIAGAKLRHRVVAVIATHTFDPSNTTERGNVPTGNVPRIAPSEAGIFTTELFS